MKKLLAILVLGLFLITPSWAEDIRDFQIEGISIGDSLLDYFSEEEIKANSQNFPDGGKYFYVAIYDSKYFNVFDGVQFLHKKSDRMYKIYSITGYIDYDKNIDGCYKKLNELDKELSILFKDAKRSIPKTVKHPADKSGKSTIKEIFYDFPSSGDVASISCADWSSKMNYPDALYVNLDLQEVRNPPRCYNGYCY